MAPSRPATTVTDLRRDSRDAFPVEVTRMEVEAQVGQFLSFHLGTSDLNVYLMLGFRTLSCNPWTLHTPNLSATLSKWSAMFTGLLYKNQRDQKARPAPSTGPTPKEIYF